MNYLMMQKDEIELLRRKAKRGWIAFGIGMLLLLGAAFYGGYYTGERRTYEQASQAFDLMLDEQRTLNDHILRTQQSAMVEREIVIEAAKQIRERDEVVRYNQENQCPDFTKAMARRK